VDVGVRVHLRDVETLDDVADLTAPNPVELDDIVATASDVYRIEVVLWTPSGSPCVPPCSGAASSASWSRRSEMPVPDFQTLVRALLEEYAAGNERPSVRFIVTTMDDLQVLPSP
jgi:hypothetical protein